MWTRPTTCIRDYSKTFGKMPVENSPLIDWMIYDLMVANIC